MEKIRITSVQKVGNSLAVIIPAGVAKTLFIERGDQIAFAIYDPAVITLRRLSQDELRQMKPPIINYGKN